MKKVLTFGSLFAGIGGFDLGLEAAGMECKWQVEYDNFCHDVLNKRWSDVPKYKDIRGVNGYELERVDVICGGFPCQPFSTAGKRKGTNDERYLWPEMLRIIEEVRPTWVIGENVTGLLTMEQPDSTVVMEDETTICKESEMVFETIRQDLEKIGYQSIPVTIPACAVGAWHKRERVWIIAHSNCNCN